MDPTRRELFQLAGSAAALGAMDAPGAALDPGIPLRFRQVHLDFHTSELIAGVGDAFDPGEFAATLEKARVNSITCFARCHHGMIYFDTRKFPERRHPNLKRNLLKEQIEACHARNIRVPIYTTIQWDYYTANRHLDWLVLDEKGTPPGTPINEPGFYRYICTNSPYGDFLRAHIEEILESVPVDGLFFDIVQPRECCCWYCRELMRKQGLDWQNVEHRRRFGIDSINAWKRETTRLVRSRAPAATIFYNAGHIGPRHRAIADAYTHFEMESLPSGGWGYLDFPLKQRYVRTIGIDALGMTGKFHTSWGDFHSFKDRAALEFECFHALALGAKCSIGDQLHPTGRIDPATYDLIGGVYREVEKKEPWCAGARGLADVGVLTPEEFTGGSPGLVPPAALGAVRMLQELGAQFDVLDSKSDFAPYRLLILPDAIPVSSELGAKLERHLNAGRGLIASHNSGPLGALGIEVVGDAPYSPDFLVPKGAIGRGLPSTEHVMYLKGKQVRPLPGSEVLAEVVVPYFNRTAEHFSSHRHTPSSGKPGYPGIVRKGGAVYFAHPVFTQYHRNAPLWVKRLVANAIGLLLPEPLVRTNAPSTLIAALSEQPRERRLVLHLLHYIPERRGQDFDVIEDVIPLRDLKVSLRADRPVREVRTAPEGQALAWREAAGRIEFTLPLLNGHQMIALDLA